MSRQVNARQILIKSYTLEKITRGILSETFRSKMPLYEGIGLISEKHAVVLDIGTSLTKCGYAGEMSPR